MTKEDQFFTPSEGLPTMATSRTADDLLRPEAIGTRGVPPPTAFVALAEVTGLAQVAVRTGGEVKPPHLTAKAHIFLGFPDIRQRLFVHVPEEISAHEFSSAVHGNVSVIMR